MLISTNLTNDAQLIRCRWNYFVFSILESISLSLSPFDWYVFKSNKGGLTLFTEKFLDESFGSKRLFFHTQINFIFSFIIIFEGKYYFTFLFTSTSKRHRQSYCSWKIYKQYCAIVCTIRVHTTDRRLARRGKK